jgi:hypothetical protein
MPDQQQQSQPLTAPAPTKSKSTIRVVQFVVDRETIVPAEVIREHLDGTLDLRGKFLQHGFTTVKESAVNPTDGRSAEFDVEVPQLNEEVVTRLGVRRADEGEQARGKCQPGTWFD